MDFQYRDVINRDDYVKTRDLLSLTEGDSIGSQDYSSDAKSSFANLET